jgi:aminopeptidase-like protein
MGSPIQLSVPVYPHDHRIDHWLATHEDIVPFVKHGLVLTGLGDRGKVTYKKSRQGEADRIMKHVLKHSKQIISLSISCPMGMMSWQFCSPGFNLPVGSLCDPARFIS